jgi:hypothetical protein
MRTDKAITRRDNEDYVEDYVDRLSNVGSLWVTDPTFGAGAGNAFRTQLARHHCVFYITGVLREG